VLVQQEQLLLFCRKQTEPQQQRSQRSGREICSFEIPVMKKRQFPEIAFVVNHKDQADKGFKFA
jgi:hypothetical protein